jgi:hypothetical protein
MASPVAAPSKVNTAVADLLAVELLRRQSLGGLYDLQGSILHELLYWLQSRWSIDRLSLVVCALDLFRVIAVQPTRNRTRGHFSNGWLS